MHLAGFDHAKHTLALPLHPHEAISCIRMQMDAATKALAARRLLQNEQAPPATAPTSTSSSIPLQWLSPSSSQNEAPGDTGFAAAFSPSIGIILVVLLTSFFFIGLFSVHVRRQTGGDGNQENETNPNGNNNQNGEAQYRSNCFGLDPATVATLPVVAYTKKKGCSECAVCLTEFEEEEAVKMLPKCKHAFHTSCIDMWLFVHTTCPVCRRSLLSQGKSWRWGSIRSPPSLASMDNAEVETSRRRLRPLLRRSHSTGHSFLRKTFISSRKLPTPAAVLPTCFPRSRSVSHVTAVGVHNQSLSPPSGPRRTPLAFPATSRVWGLASLKRLTLAAMVSGRDSASSPFSLPLAEASTSTSARRTFERLFPV